MSIWQVKLPRFEGPLDLLLFLVTRKEYDILDLPMAEITETYLEALDDIGVENLEDAGDYLLMAATLLSIKAKMLLPQPPVTEEFEADDPRRDLAERLMIYARIKQASEDLGEFENRMLERRPLARMAVPESDRPVGEELLMPLSVYDLARTMEEILSRREAKIFHEVRMLKVSVDERIDWVMSLIARAKRFGLLENLRDVPDRIIWVATFLALLELAKRGIVWLDQNIPFAELYVSEPDSTEARAA
ncbi:segregation/condensation protein A [bacterium]|nr:segregation/condensation protein A [bacterium]